MAVISFGVMWLMLDWNELIVRELNPHPPHVSRSRPECGSTSVSVSQTSADFMGSRKESFRLCSASPWRPVDKSTPAFPCPYSQHSDRHNARSLPYLLLLCYAQKAPVRELASG